MDHHPQLQKHFPFITGSRPRSIDDRDGRIGLQATFLKRADVFFLDRRDAIVKAKRSACSCVYLSLSLASLSKEEVMNG